MPTQGRCECAIRKSKCSSCNVQMWDVLNIEQCDDENWLNIDISRVTTKIPEFRLVQCCDSVVSWKKDTIKGILSGLLYGHWFFCNTLKIK